MPTNLPPVNNNAITTASLVAGVEQARAEKIATIAKLIGITVGNNVLATVEKVEPIDPQQREQLLKRTQEVLMQLQRAPLTPAVKQQVQQLLEQQQLLQSPQLKLVQLLVNGRPLITYTDRPLVAGQALPVQLTENQRLVMLDPQQLQRLLAVAGSDPLRQGQLDSALRAQANSTPAAEPNRGTPDLRVNLTRQLTQIQTLLEIQQPVTDKPAASSNLPQVRLLLAEALRSVLPQQDQPRELYTALPQLQQLPMSHRHALLPQSLQQALKTAADQLRTPDQLSNPRLLQLALKNSGVFFESKLASNLLPTKGDQSKPEQPTQPKAAGNTNDTQVLTNRLTTQDLKGALLQLLSQTRQALGREASTDPARANPSTATQPLTPLASAANSAELRLPSGLPSLLHLLQQLPQRQVQELSSKQLRTQLLLLLQQHALSSLGRVQMQQLHTLNHQLTQADAPQPSQSWIFELPVKQGQDVHHLELRLQQEWIEEKDDGEEDGQGTKKRQWSVTLSFDLPDAGPFHAQLQVIDESVSARLWAEREPTLRETRAKLDQLRQQLESEGIKVKQLQCVEGTPPSTRMSLNYSLVDVTT